MFDRVFVLALTAVLAATPLSLRAQQVEALELEAGDTLAVLGNRLAEGLQHEGQFEALLQAQFPELGLRVRNLGFSGDEVGAHQRTMNFGKFSADPLDLDLPEDRFLVWDRYLEHVSADVIIACFGFCESFAGFDGLSPFHADLVRFVEHVRATAYDDGGPATLVLVGPPLVEDLGDPSLPDAAERNRLLPAYAAVMRRVAAEHGVRYLDPSGTLTEARAAQGAPLTFDGVHLDARGYAVFGAWLAEAFGATATEAPSAELLQLVRAKNALWFRRYQAVDGYNLYGDRSRLAYEEAGREGRVTNFEVLQREMDRLDAAVALHEARIHGVVRGEVEPELDARQLPELRPVVTNRPGPLEGGAYPFLGGEEAIASMTTAPNMRVNLFVDESLFPEFVNPVQMAWDPAGRLWVLVWPSYPSARADQAPHDKLLVLEDVDGDGRADTCTTFADDLADPTGLEHWNGGVFVACAPELLFLKDTDGDGHYDTKERVLTGLSSADTHHAANSFVLGPDGALYFQEGTFHRSQVETVHGVVRNRNACAWRYEPRTRRLERYAPYNFANPHGHVFDRWGQDFLTDGTGNVNYYALPFSGHLPEPLKKRPYFPFFQQRSRPAGGTEILSSAHFPDENQGNYLIANVIGFRGIFQYEVEDDGSGFQANEIAPIVESSDPNFRPVDIEMGPDGALYFLDWHNPLIGHMQHHIRDPSRDKRHGRVYRVTYEGRELVEPVNLAEASDEALLEALRSRDDRVRYRARIELSGRPRESVLAGAAASLDVERPHDLLERLWLGQQHDSVDARLLELALAHREPRVRAAATRVVRQMRHQVPNALELLARSAGDESPRVRLEAVVAASFLDDAGAVEVALAVLARPLDRFLEYALEETLRALEPHWKAGLEAGTLALETRGMSHLLGRLSLAELRRVPASEPVLEELLVREELDAPERLATLERLAEERGTTPRALALELVDRLAATTAPATLVQLAAPALADARAARATFERFASAASEPALRTIGFAGLIAGDKRPDQALGLANAPDGGLEALFASIQLVPDATTRAATFSVVNALARSVPAHLAASQPGLAVSFFEPAPADATRERLASLVPRATTRSTALGLELDVIGKSDSFGLAFEGLLRVTAPGRYTFWTNSDDGSRLYVGNTCVVENDGPHAMLEAEGSIELTAGLHPFTVTYFESGGGDGLEVRWSGPGFERQPIPADALSSNGELALRAAAIRALAHVPGHDDEKLERARAWYAEPGLGDAPLVLLESLTGSEHAGSYADTLVAQLVDDLESLPVEARTSPDAARKSALARAFGASLGSTARAELDARLDLLGGTTIAIGTLPHRMLYDVTEFFVEAGSAVAIDFANADSMPHNLVLVRPGTMASVGAAAEAMATQPGADAKAFVPAHPDVLFHTGLVLPGESERLAFRAPTEPGDYPFVCTYPGHWRVMNGVLHVVTKLDAAQRSVERADVGEVTLRPFVRNWTFAELEPRFESDWHAGRSVERGEVLFKEAGCLTCHCPGRGVFGAPDLAELRPELRGKELLRHVLDPSREIVAGYEYHVFELESGARVAGRLLGEDDVDFAVAPLNVDVPTYVPKDAVVDRWIDNLSPMPTGMLVTLDEDEILDLLHYVETTGQPDDSTLWLDLPGGAGPGEGLHVVLLAGDEEYRSEEALPMLARLLAERHGFRATVLFSTNPSTGAIDPDESHNVPGMQLLDDADLVVCSWRFRSLPDADMEHFVRYVESGKPLIGLRTATHAFAYPADTQSAYARYGWNSSEWPGGFGRQLLGETWVAHHGHHGVESTRGVRDLAALDHPILTGVREPWGKTDVYAVRDLPEDATVLLRGVVLAGMEPDSPPVAGPKNDPTMPLAWARERALDGGVQRIVCTTMGSSQDFADAMLRRFLLNACLWCVGREARISPELDVDVVGDYAPTAFGFGAHRRGVFANDLR